MVSSFTLSWCNVKKNKVSYGDGTVVIALFACYIFLIYPVILVIHLLQAILPVKDCYVAIKSPFIYLCILSHEQ